MAERKTENYGGEQDQGLNYGKLRWGRMYIRGMESKFWETAVRQKIDHFYGERLRTAVGKKDW